MPLNTPAQNRNAEVDARGEKCSNVNHASGTGFRRLFQPPDLRQKAE